MSMHSFLIDAIRNRLVIEFRYDDVHRIAHPYVFGESKERALLLRAWQVQGRPGSRPEWRTFDVAKISGATTTGMQFVPEPHGVWHRESTMHTIYAQI